MGFAVVQMTTSKLLLVLVVVCVVSAFKPNPQGHVGITDEALRDLGFCRNARDAVENANILTDIFEQFTNEAHFDGESIKKGSQRLLSKREEVSDLMDEAVKLQDDDDSILEFFDSTFDFFQQAFNAFTGNSPLFILDTNDAQLAAWSALGQGLHSLQDFYSHSNWIEMGNNAPFASLGVEQVPNPPKDSQPCPVDPGVLDLSGDGGSVLTTGYFEFNPAEHCELEAEPGKCRHGWDLAGCADGLNKDEPTRPNYAQARAVAVQASRQYVQQVMNDLQSRSQTHLDLFLGSCDISNETLIFIREVSTSSSCDTFSFELDEIGSSYELTVTMDDIDSVRVIDPNNNHFSEDATAIIGSDEIDVEIEHPVPGTYSVEVCGKKGKYVAEVVATSKIFPYEFYFARQAGTRNTDSFPHSAEQQPVLNTDNELYAELYGADIDASSVQFHLVSIDGERTIQSFSLTPTASADGVEFTGVIQIGTTEQFYVAASGRDTSGDSFIRVYRTKAYQAQYVEIENVGQVDVFNMEQEGDEVRFEVLLQNHNTISVDYDLSLSVTDHPNSDFSARFNVQASRSVISDRVSLLAGEERLIFADLTLEDDSDLSHGDLISVRFRARASSANSDNSLVLVGQFVGEGSILDDIFSPSPASDSYLLLPSFLLSLFLFVFL